MGNQSLSLHLGWFFFRAIISILFGLLVLTQPVLITIYVFTIFFGAYALVDGIGSIILGLGERKRSSAWVWKILSGIIGIIAGGIVLFSPTLWVLTALPLMLVYIVGFWAIAMGIIQIISALQGRTILSPWIAFISGILTLIFGVYCMINPVGGILTILWLIGIFSLINGIIGIIIAFQVWGLKNNTLSSDSTPGAA
ncbi:HdeD family acid-resistance protein [Anaerolineales bacterium]